MTITPPEGSPDLAALKAWLGLDEDDTQDDVLLQESLDAAMAQQALVVVYPVGEYGDALLTTDLREAVFLRAQRLAARRNSPEGVVGVAGTAGDFTSVRVPAYDSDVASIETPHRRIAVS